MGAALFTVQDMVEFWLAGGLVVAGIALSIVGTWPTRPRRRPLVWISVALIAAALIVGFLPFVSRGLPLIALIAIAAFFALIQARSFGLFIAKRPPS